MNVNAHIPQQWWERIRWTRYGFFAGLFLGVGIGWFFHGLISFIVRFGLVLLLILPLLVIGWLWLRSSRSGRSGDPAAGERRVVTWTSTNIPPNEPFEPFEAFEPVVDVPTGRTRRADPDAPYARTQQSRSTQATGRSIPTDVERELRELKRQQERGR